MMSLNTLTSRSIHSASRLIAPTFVALLAVHCGGEEPEPPPPPTTVALFDVEDPCGTNVPAPSNFFVDADGQPETTDCVLPDNAIDAAIELAQRFDGAPVDSEVSVPMDGSLDPRSLSSTVSFSLTGGSTGAASLPAVVLLANVGTATLAEGWQTVDANVTFNNSAVRVRPEADLAFNTFHVLIVTRTAKDSEQPPQRLGQSKAVSLLLGSSPIAAGAVEGLTATGAARMERMRQQLAPLVALLATATPPMSVDDIASVHGFTTEKGEAHVTGAIDDYFSALERGRYGFEQSNRVVPFSEVYPGLPAIAYDGLAEFRVGTIKAPKVLDDEGHIRANWTEQVETVDIPFSLSIPSRSNRYGLTVFVPGFGRGKIDGRAIAPQLANAATSAVLTIDLRCHGDRSRDASGLCGENRDAQEVAALEDDEANNGNPEFNGADGIPDDSGIGFFPGDPRALRDTQIAAIIEILHVLGAVRAASTTFEAPINVNVAQIHLIAQGHAAPAALGAMANVRFPTNSITLQLPSGGVGYDQLILDGPEDLRQSFLSSAPEGVEPGDAASYLAELEDTILAPLDTAAWGAEVRQRLRLTGNQVRVLLNHSRVAEYVTTEARDDLADQLSLGSNRQSQHNGACDDFFLYTCSLGDNPAWLEEARGQFASFVSSGGVTFSAPAP